MGENNEGMSSGDTLDIIKLCEFLDELIIEKCNSSKILPENVKGIIMNPTTCEFMYSLKIRLTGSGCSKNPTYRGIKVYRSLDIEVHVFEVFV